MAKLSQQQVHPRRVGKFLRDDGEVTSASAAFFNLTSIELSMSHTLIELAESHGDGIVGANRVQATR